MCLIIDLVLLGFLIKSIFKPGVVFNIVRPYIEKEMHSLNESGGQILKIVPNISTENLPRFSASYQGYRDFGGGKKKQSSYHRGAQRMLYSNH